MGRRKFLQIVLSGTLACTLGNVLKAGMASAGEALAKLARSDDDWKASLTSEQYAVLRQEGTERPFSSPLLKEHRDGVFACVGCDLPLFNSDQKFESGTGWPSFFDAIPEHLGTTTDYKLLYPRTEYHCARCSGHHGHIFKDGPKPTGLRYCSNGVALKFIPKES